MNLTIDDLSPDQRSAYDAILTWLNRGADTKPTLTLAGYAGSGKSSVVSVLAHALPTPAFCAFTGKASSVLGRKLAEAGIATVNRCIKRDPDTGVAPFEPRPYCGTIHGLIYRPCPVCMIEEEVHEHLYSAKCREPHPAGVASAIATAMKLSPQPCLACDPPPAKRGKDGYCGACNNARFLRRTELDRDYGLLVVDEASMVSDDLLEDLKSFGVPILGVGDHGQLPPVRGTGSLMKHPDLRLEKIHRQAEGNPIIALSKRIRETGDIDDAMEDGDRFLILPSRKFEAYREKTWTKERLEADPLGLVGVAWTNRKRVALNQEIRTALGYKGEKPKSGEVLICLKNAPPIYNGMRGTLVGDAQPAGDAGGKAPKLKVSVNFLEDRQKAENILISELQFFEEKTIDFDQVKELGVSMAQLGQLYDFGYALTCHKMQGSQAGEVCVFEEPGLSRMGREDRARWMYTAVTRAASRLVWVR